VSSPRWVRDRAPAENGFWRIIKATERSFLYLTKSGGGEVTICISVPRSKFWGDLSSLSPVIYAHDVESRVYFMTVHCTLNLYYTVRGFGRCRVLVLYIKCVLSSCHFVCLYTSIVHVFTALRAMQTRSSDENSVRPSVRPSVCQTRAL